MLLANVMFTGQKWYFTEGFCLVLDRVKIVNESKTSEVMVNVGGLWYKGDKIWQTVKGGENSFWQLNRENKDNCDVSEKESLAVVRAVDAVRGIIHDILRDVRSSALAKERFVDILARVRRTVVSEKMGVEDDFNVRIGGVKIFVGAVVMAEIEKREQGLGLRG